MSTTIDTLEFEDRPGIYDILDDTSKTVWALLSPQGETITINPREEIFTIGSRIQQDTAPLQTEERNVVIGAEEEWTVTADGTIVLRVDGATGVLAVQTNLTLTHDGTRASIFAETGQMDIGTKTSSSLRFRVQNSTHAYFPAAGGFVLGSASIQTGAVLDVQTTAEGHAFVVGDDGSVRMPFDGNSTQCLSIGAGNDLRLYHTGSASYIYNGPTGGDLSIYSVGGGNDILFYTAATQRGRWDAAGALVIGSGSAEVGAVLDVQSIGQAHALTVEDDTGIVRIPHDTAGALRIGAGDDLQFWHNGTDCYGYAYTGHLNIGTTTAKDIIFRTNSSIVARLEDTGCFAVGSATPVSGAVLDVQSTSVAHAFVVNDDGTIEVGRDGTGSMLFGTNDRLSLGANTSNGYVSSSGVLYLEGSAAVYLRASSASWNFRTSGSVRLPTGTEDTTNGAIWWDGTDFLCRKGGITHTFNTTAA